MMIERSILIFPEFKNIHEINYIRQRYDPLAKHVRPHITLVFPFLSNITTANFKKHVTECIKDFKKFNLTLQDLMIANNQYMFLNISKGSEEIIHLQDKLYTGILSNFYPEFLRKFDFVPHLTVGKLEKNHHDIDKIVEDVNNFNGVFSTTVEEISVEIIEKNLDSTIEFTVNLQ